MSEKALAIGAYAAASGACVIFGIESPVEYSEEVTRVMNKVWEKELGGRMIFANDDETMFRETLAHIDKKRATLGLPEYDPNRFGRSGDWRIEELVALPLEAQVEALYGGVR
jgi:hypothetical protein